MSQSSTGLSTDERGHAGGAPEPITANVKTLASMLGLSERMVWKLIAEGKLRSTSVGKRRLVFVDSARQLLAENASAA